MEKTSLLYWFPIIKDLPIPMPRTTWVEIPFEVFAEYAYADFEREEKLRIAEYTDQVKLKASETGYPLFLRTDLASGKHSWEKSCYVKSEDELLRGIWGVVEFNFTADFFGLQCEALVFREYIPMASGFTAFWGKLPINPERRYFIRDGKVECHHPYWTEGALVMGEFWIDNRNWKDLLRVMNKEPSREVKLLTSYAEQVASVLPGYWSVDFCKAKDSRWILIDLAEGEKSWHPEH